MNWNGYLGDRVLDGLIGAEVVFVADENLIDGAGRIAINLLDPLLDILERFQIGAVVNDDDAVGSSVIA